MFTVFVRGSVGLGFMVLGGYIVGGECKEGLGLEFFRVVGSLGWVLFFRARVWEVVVVVFFAYVLDIGIFFFFRV